MSNWELLKAKMKPEKKRRREEEDETSPSKKSHKKRKSSSSGSSSKKHKTKTPETPTTSEAPAVTAAPLDTLVVNKKSKKIGKYLALDCEMVGTNAPPIGPREVSTLARVSITNYHGHVIYDTYVSPPKGHTITDYRTWVSGIQAHHLYRAPTFEHVQTQVRELLAGRILIGHALVNDFRALKFTHPKQMVRDTSTFAKFKGYGIGRTPGLKKVAQVELGIDIQGAAHSSVEDARACMALYRKYKAEFELKAAQKSTDKLDKLDKKQDKEEAASKRQGKHEKREKTLKHETA